jgi:hypothetical protein
VDNVGKVFGGMRKEPATVVKLMMTSPGNKETNENEIRKKR